MATWATHLAGAVTALSAFALPGTAMAADPEAPWTEAVVSVADIGPWYEFLGRVGGWQGTGEGALSESELAYWKVDGTGQWLRMCAPAAEIGCIRFVRFDGVEQEPVRPAARAWDTGGIFSLMVRTDDVDALYAAAIDTPGWWAESPPVAFDFGTSSLRNVVITGPHGIHIAAYERIAPEFTAFPVGRISQAFNSMRFVRNKATARDFYRSLGFNTYFDSNDEAVEPTWSNFSIPVNFTPMVRRIAAAMQPGEGETGRVEVMQLVGFEGRDYADKAVAPNLGILSVRYPVADPAAYRKSLEAKGVPVTYAADGVAVGNAGKWDLFAVRSPDGALTEFYAPSE